jgi:hypothetical protein
MSRLWLSLRSAVDVLLMTTRGALRAAPPIRGAIAIAAEGHVPHSDSAGATGIGDDSNQTKATRGLSLK